jgi:hypothetical protein
MIARIFLTILAVGVAVVTSSMPAVAGGPGDTPPSCLVANPPGGATALRGTVAVGVENAVTQGNTNVDFTLRLERGGALAFLRASVNMTVFATSNENILCTLLADSSDPGAIALRAAILQAFGFRNTANFFIVDKSVSKAEIQGSTNQWLCNSTFTTPAPLSSPPPSCQSPPRGSSMADVLLYVK